MIDISPQISEAPLQEHLRLDDSPFVKKRGSKDALGVFARLLAGLLKKNPGAGAGKTGVETVPMETNIRKTVQSKESTKKTKAAEVLSVRRNGKKQDREEFAVSLSGQKAVRPVKKTGTGTAENPAGEIVVPVRFSPENSLNPAGTETAEKRLESLGIRQNREHENLQLELKEAFEKIPDQRIFGKKTGVKDNIPSENPQIPVFSRTKPAEKPSVKDEEQAHPRTRKKERIVEVRDLRTQGEAHARLEPVPVTTETISTEREMVLELRSVGEKAFAGKAAEDYGADKTSENGRSFESLLAERLSGNLSTDIVKQASLVLRDGGEGTIRLSIKPETLGKVKIHLEMVENKISGHIFVESEEALRAFEKEIHTLEQAFRDSGFSEASLDTALNSGNRWKGEEPRPFFSRRFAASRYDPEPERSVTAYAENGLSAVNMLV